ncbi:MAG: cupin domain-containing protein [Bacteroidota bacterium]
MKIIKSIFMLLLFVILPSLYTDMYAQDPPIVAPNIYKRVALDNERARVMDVEIAAGEVVPWHTHPDHVLYVLSGGKIEITDKDKLPVSMDLNVGDVLFIPAVTHTAKNIGTTTIKIIVTEIKKGNKKMK